MNCLEERILKDGLVKEGNVLKVDSFLNHQMDIALFNEMGKEWKRRFEGKSFTIDENGKKQYTDEIINNPEGKTPYDAIAKYCNNPGFMKIYDTEAIHGLDNSLEPDILAKRRESEKRAEESDKGLGIPSLAYTTEETKELNKIKTELVSYLEEMKAKFILGKEGFDNYDAFLSTIRELGAERAVEIMQTAFDRYNEQ